jgi:hypothetical protein
MAEGRRVTAFIALALVTISMIVAAQQDVLTSLGVKVSTAQEQMIWSLSDGHVPIGLAAAAFRSMDGAARARAVQGIMAWAKAYTESASFKTAYSKQRERDKPAPLGAKGSVDEELARQREEQRKNLEQAKKNAEKMPPDLRKSMEATIRQLEEQQAQMASDPKMASMIRQGIEMQRAGEAKAYQERLRAHETRYPEDPRILIAQRLRQFLDLSADVDFTARLVRTESVKFKFAEPKYEMKPSNWRLCFRAGKEAVGAARAFAASWLKEIETR